MLYLTHQNTLFYTISDLIDDPPPPPPQSQKVPKKILRKVFLDKFQTVPSFLPSPYFGAKFQILLFVLSGHYLIYIGQIRFQNLCLSNVIEEEP